MAVQTKAERLQTQKDHAVERLRKRLAHEADASALDQHARLLEARKDHAGAEVLRTKAAQARVLAEGFR